MHERLLWLAEHASDFSEVRAKDFDLFERVPRRWLLAPRMEWVAPLPLPSVADLIADTPMKGVRVVINYTQIYRERFYLTETKGMLSAIERIKLGIAVSCIFGKATESSDAYGVRRTTAGLKELPRDEYVLAFVRNRDFQCHDDDGFQEIVCECALVPASFGGLE